MPTITTSSLDGMTVAILVSDGFEQVEMTEPRKALEGPGREDAGRLAARRQRARLEPPRPEPTPSRSTCCSRPRTPTTSMHCCCLAASSTPMPCASTRRRSPSCALFVEAGKPIAAICHGPWTLIDAERRQATGAVTSWPSLRADLAQRGREVERPRRWWSTMSLVTSRKPDRPVAGRPTARLTKVFELSYEDAVRSEHGVRASGSMSQRWSAPCSAPAAGSGGSVACLLEHVRRPAHAAREREQHQRRIGRQCRARRERGQREVDVRRASPTQRSPALAQVHEGRRQFDAPRAARRSAHRRADSSGWPKAASGRSCASHSRARRLGAQTARRRTRRLHGARRRRHAAGRSALRAGKAGNGRERGAGRGRHARREGRGIELVVGQQHQRAAQSRQRRAAGARPRRGAHPQRLCGSASRARCADQRIGRACPSPRRPSARKACGERPREGAGRSRARSASASRPACSGGMPSRAVASSEDRRGGAHSHSRPATSSSVASIGSAQASCPRYQSRPPATVDTAEGSTGSPHWIASLATASLLRRPLRARREPLHVVTVVEAAPRVGGIGLGADAAAAHAGIERLGPHLHQVERFGGGKPEARSGSSC